jgi:hypothetical protein
MMLPRHAPIARSSFFAVIAIVMRGIIGSPPPQ